MQALRVGMLLPVFVEDGRIPVETARVAEASGLDGVFAYDHLWPMGSPDRPALSCTPLLGAIAAATSSVAVGPLVARIGIVPDAVLVNEILTIDRIAGPGRLVAALGTGDSLSRHENEAFGIAYPPASERLERVGAVAAELRDAGIHTWIGGRSLAVREVVARCADALNVWAATPGQIEAEGAELIAAGKGVTWGGMVEPGDGPDAIASMLRGVAGAGATWAVCGVASAGRSIEAAMAAVETLAEVRRLVGGR